MPLKKKPNKTNDPNQLALYFSIYSNVSRTRLNILGAIKLGAIGKAVINRFDCNIDSEVTAAFLPQLRDRYKTAKQIHLIMEQAGYYKARNVLELASKLAIKIHFLPPHSPNLNPIKRLWKVMNKMSRNNRFFKSSASFRKSIDDFFKFTLPDIAEELEITINDHCQQLNTVA